MQMNGITNVEIVQADSHAFCTQILKTSTYESLSSGQNLHFDVVLVDPPRAGLDEATCHLVSRYPFVIYISCKPSSLARDLRILAKTHVVRATAFLDQFPYTKHAEVAVFLEHC